MAKQKSEDHIEIKGNNSTERYLIKLVGRGVATSREVPPRTVREGRHNTTYFGHTIYQIKKPPLEIESHECEYGFGNLVYRLYKIKGEEEEARRFGKTLERNTRR